MSQGKKYPYAEALGVAREIAGELRPAVARVEIVGSLRRRKEQVGDVELLYIPRWAEPGEVDLFGEALGEPVNLADERLVKLLEREVLAMRRSTAGHTSWGRKNKLAVHTASGIPVDLFAATLDNWTSMLVCRTGPAELNIRICEAARERGWRWDPYSGFWRVGADGLRYAGRRMASEEAFFDFVGMECVPPPRRAELVRGVAG